MIKSLPAPFIFQNCMVGTLLVAQTGPSEQGGAPAAAGHRLLTAASSCFMACSRMLRGQAALSRM